MSPRIVPVTGRRARIEAECRGRNTDSKIGQIGVPALGVVVMAKYLVLFGFSSEAIKQFVMSPSDRAAAVRRLVESVGGSLECYYWMFGQYDGVAIVEMPDSRTQAAATLAIISSDAFTHFETHELIEVEDLARIAVRAKNIAYQPPGAERPHRPGDSAYGINPAHGRTV